MNNISRRIGLAFVAMMLTSVALHAQVLTSWITAPNGGEVYAPGASITVFVNQTIYNPNSIAIELYNGSTKVYGPWFTNPSASGSQIYPAASQTPVGGNYKIRVYDLNNSSKEDWSDAPFTIGPNLSSWVQSPNGRTFASTSTFSILLNTSTYNPSSVTLEVYKGSTLVWGPQSGSATGRTITLPGVALGNDYRVKAYDTNIPSLADWSDTYNSVVAFSSWVVNPNGGGYYNPGGPLSFNIASFYTPPSTSPTLELYKGSTMVQGPIVIGSNGSFTLSSALAYGSDYKLRAYDAGDPAIQDYSDAPFTIGPNLTSWVQTPNGGVYALNTAINVQLNTGTFNPASVTLELYKGATKVWGPVTGSATGRTIPLTGLAAGTDYKLKAYDTSIPALVDWSDNNISIIDFSSWVVNPNGGGYYNPGGPLSFTIASFYTPPTSPTLELYKGSTMVQGPIVMGSNGSFTLSSALAYGSDYKLRAYDPGDPNKQDYSDAPFTIGPNLTSWVQTPNGGVYALNTAINVQLNTGTFNPASVTLELYKGATKVWGPVTGSATGRTVPLIGLAAGTDYKLKAYDTSIPALVDWSDNNISIIDFSSWVVNPNGGGYYNPGGPLSFTIASFYTPPTSPTLELYKGSTMVQGPIVMGSNGSFTLSSALAYGSDYKLRAYDPGDPNKQDYSDAPFTIGPDLTNWIQEPNGNKSYALNSVVSVQLNTTAYNPASVTLELYKGATKVWGPVTGSAAGRTIPLTGLAAGNDYKLKAYDTSIPLLADWSNNYFNIVNLSSWLTAPNGGEIFCAGSGLNFTANTSIYVPPSSAPAVEIYKGTTKVAGPFTVGNVGTIPIPADIVPGNDFKLRIYDVQNGQNEDYSDNAFTILPPTVQPTAIDEATNQTVVTSCTGTFGPVSLTENNGTVVNWEYSTSSATGPWTNWAQAGMQTTTTASFPAGASLVWVRANLTYPGSCVNSSASSSVPMKYIKGISPSVPANPSGPSSTCVGSTVFFTTTTTSGATSYIWRIQGFDPVVTTVPSVSFQSPTKGTFSVAVSAVSDCGEVAALVPASLTVFASYEGVITKSVISQTDFHYSCAENFGNTEVVSPPGTVSRWEYSTVSQGGPWTTWGQPGQVTTSTALPAFQSRIYVRAIMSTSCGEIASKVTTYAREKSKAYTRMYVPEISYTSADGVAMAANTPGNVVSIAHFFDGVGRDRQTVTRFGSSTDKDLVEFNAYDEFGRENIKYLPYATTTSPECETYKPDDKSTQLDFYGIEAPDGVPVDDSPFAVTMFEPSPLNRVLKQGEFGHTWQPGSADPYSTSDNTTKFRTEFNAANSVLIWKYDNGTGLISAKNTSGILQYYDAGELVVRKIIAADGKVTYQYIDKRNNIVLNRTQATASGAVDDINYAATYSVYDDLGYLRVTLSPEAVSRLTAEYHSASAANQEIFLSNWAYRYKYDELGRAVQKKMPGADWLYIVYDKLNRPAMMQDGNQRPNKEWKFVKYDQQNRAVIVGIYVHPTVVDQAAMAGLLSTTVVNEKYVGATSPPFGYSNSVFPTTSTTIMSAVYYDNYNFKTLQGSGNASRYQFVPDHLTGQQSSESMDVSGKITGSHTAILDEAIYKGTTNTYLWKVNYYDGFGRLCQIVSDNYKGGTDLRTITYDFKDRIAKTKATHMEGLTWRDLVGVGVYGNRVARLITGGGWISGTASKEFLPASTDGWFEFRPAMTTNTVVIGFGLSNPDTNWTSTRFGIYLNGTNGISYIENGVLTSLLTATYAVNDVLRLERVGTQFKVYKNGTLLLTRTMPTSAYLVDVSIASNSSHFVGFKTSFGVKQDLEKRYVYDHIGRLKQVWNKAGTANEVLTQSHTYAANGDLSSNGLHSTNGTDFEQVVDYRHNIRGWLTRINSADLEVNPDQGPRDYFGEEIGYDQFIGLGGVPQYVNGKISAIKWSTNLGLNGGGQSAYAFNYDILNRLKDANYKVKHTVWTDSDAFAERNISYDLNGNVAHLERTDEEGTLIDNLTYQYFTGSTDRSNKLLLVSDGSDDTKGFKEASLNPANGVDYVYDANGNLIQDRNRGGGESLVNGSFDSGGANWTLGGTTSRVTYGAGAANIAAGASSVVFRQVGVIEPGKVYAVTIDLQKTSTNGGVTINLAGTGSSYFTQTGIISFSITAGPGNPSDLTIQLDNQWAGKINSISAQGVATIAYNVINRPKVVSTAGQGYVATVYDAWGQKLEQEACNSQNTVQKRVDYGGEFVYDNGSFSYVVHEAGRIIPGTSNSDWEYQYHLKDHLGNTRVSFTTKDNVTTETATMETANAATEQGQFLNYSEAVKINSALFDHTNNGSTAYSTRLKGGNSNEKIGLAKSLSVMPGDVINVEVFAKYLDPQNSNWTAALATFIQSITQGTAPAGTFVDGGSPGSIGNGTFPYGSLLDKGDETATAPKAYLNWLLFDGSMNFKDGGYARVDASAREYGQDAPHQQLSRQIKVTEPGFVYIYLSNENDTEVEVYFDDLTVEHIQSPIVQINEYYPFGLGSQSWTREDVIPDPFLFNGGSELNSTTEWYETYFRGYDPAIGRFMQIDPAAELFPALSPYSFANNDPVLYNDPFGLLPAIRKNGRALTDDDGNWIGTDEEFIEFVGVLMGRGGTAAASQYTVDGVPLTSFDKNTDGAFGTWIDGPITIVSYEQDPMTGQFYQVTKQYAGIRTQFVSLLSVIAEELGQNKVWQKIKAGYKYGPQSEYMAVSATIGLANLGVDAVAMMAKYESTVVAGAREANALKVFNGARYLSKGLGFVAAGATLIEGVTDGDLSVGDGVKVLIAVGTAVCPLGWLYAVADFGTYVATGTSITDRIGNAVDGALKDDE